MVEILSKANLSFSKSGYKVDCIVGASDCIVGIFRRKLAVKMMKPENISFENRENG